ncbi:hypothetical protein QBC39DRAFT_355489 [Podospora conica]|nr:hypothetical protein QBC39DRAFT_355489 [Schizothecium conicum]
MGPRTSLDGMFWRAGLPITHRDVAQSHRLPVRTQFVFSSFPQTPDGRTPMTNAHPQHRNQWAQHDKIPCCQAMVMMDEHTADWKRWRHSCRPDKSTNGRSRSGTMRVLAWHDSGVVRSDPSHLGGTARLGRRWAVAHSPAGGRHRPISGRFWHVLPPFASFPAPSQAIPPRFHQLRLPIPARDARGVYLLPPPFFSSGPGIKGHRIKLEAGSWLGVWEVGVWDVARHGWMMAWGCPSPPETHLKVAPGPPVRHVLMSSPE